MMMIKMMMMTVIVLFEIIVKDVVKDFTSYF